MIELSSAAAVAVSAGTAKAIEKSTASLVDKISLKFVKDKFEQIKLLLDKGLPTYLEANYAKCETLKTLLNRNDPVALEECFVAPDFRMKGKTTPSNDFLDNVNREGAKVIITGLAGSGKSVFLKHAFRQVIERGHTYYPVFFELRALNRASEKKGLLLSQLYESIRECCDSFTRAQFDYGLKSGAFYLLLDGFDELNQDIREQISDEINGLARSYSKCAIIVTSRPSDDFVSWEGFSEARLLPFDLGKVVEYIKKLNFDEEKKSDFLSDLESGVFESNKDFLSNPLLSAMMLLTYDSFGEIPEKRHIFYAKCFDVLAREHDVSKGRYKRELFSSLSMDQLERAFMFFCALSYVERTFSFNDEQMATFVGEAIASCGIEAEVADVIRDFREAISIMERVGLLYEFAHRSFQEYFYAKFVTVDRKLSLEEKIGWLTETFRSDDTIEMIADMDRTYFEDEFLLPNVEQMVKKLSTVDPTTNPAGILSKFFSLVQATTRHNENGDEQEKSTAYVQSDGSATFLMTQALRKYYDEYSEEMKACSSVEERQAEDNVAILEKEFGGEIKIHHTNNAKLLRIEAHLFAAHIKHGISCLHEHLLKKQEKRKRGLGALIKRKYS
ncbi:hypothetical protein CKO11_13435 [Rhodobacter sp. TJ_12]|uniref:NACHT domain-containing protein n=1 Tax=Rhodobacter sp. TJ_12 TaxID=2029399 RepID=UPI001CBF97CD|nr:NACHT domain-containing protein [Rhodobacter sp. TJ_12]MBZ4023460.1 hypothetical protein [Rhodobacter sp. TJ_12]